MKAIVLHGKQDMRVETVSPEDMRPGAVRIKMARGGICGSDLHYYGHGGMGMIRVKQPVILGHEVCGWVEETADDVDGLAVGDLVAISPSRPCGSCKFCDQGLFHHCLNMRFYGSAMPWPHIQGAFREGIVADATQCHRIEPGVGPEIAAFAEPLAVVLHAMNRAGDITGKNVLITGCGPIGALAVMAAQNAGAANVTVTDILNEVLATGARIGADRTINVASNPNWTEEFSADKGTFDVMFEASGIEAAFRDGLEVLRPQATLVQLGMGGDISIPQNAIVAKEIEMRGTFRFHEEFADAVCHINAGTFDLAALHTGTFGIDNVLEAFKVAADRTVSMKVQLDFTQ